MALGPRRCPLSLSYFSHSPDSQPHWIWRTRRDNANFFGFYNSLFWPYLYHGHPGWEFFPDADDGVGGAYLYDSKLAQWFYTNPAEFPFLYNFTADAWYYYFPSNSQPLHYSTNPRVFENMSTQTLVLS